MALPKTIANFETSLANSITAVATSLTLSTSVSPDGTTLAGDYLLTLDEGTNVEEHMLVTLAGSAGTIVTRALSRENGTLAVSGKAFAHNRGASVKITNFVLLKIDRELRGEQFENALQGTNAHEFKIGDATAVNNKLTANNADANKPFIIYSEVDNAWLISNDGINTYNPQAGGSGVTAGQGISITAGVVSTKLNASTKLVKNLGTGVDELGIATNTNNALDGRSGSPSASQPYETVHDSSNAATITASTISFTASTKTIADSGSGFVTANFIAGTQVTVTGSVSNNSTFTIVSVLAGAIVVAESLVDEVAGASVTMTTITANKLVRYTSTSQVKVPTTPVASNDAVSKSYTDTSVATLTTGQTSLLNHSVHAIETSNIWFTYPIALLATSSTAVAGWDTSNANMSGGGAGLTQWGISPAAGYIRASVQGHTSGNTYTAASNKDIKIKFRHKFEGAIGAGIYAGIGITNGTISTIQTDTASNSIRFVLNNATLYAANSDGANYTATDISGLMTYTNWNIYEIVFNPGVNIVYYINGTAVATHTTNLPTGNLNLFALGASNGVSTIGRISPIVISMEM